MRYIKMIRIWPRPRWPLIHEAKRIFKEQGKEAFDKWAESLSDEEREEMVIQLLDLLAEAKKKIQERGDRKE